MIDKVFLVLLISVIINARQLHERKSTSVVTEDATTPTTTSTTTSTVSPSEKNIQICTDLKPEFISTRNERYQTLECRAKICNGKDTDEEDGLDTSSVRFNQPLFDWNCQLGHIVAANGTCDYEKHYCWHSIDIDLLYLSDQMLDNGLNEIQLSCSVNDWFVTNNGDNIRFAVGTDYSYLKRFRGKTIGQSCNDDDQCGENMFCLDSGKSEATVCQCSVDFLTGVQYVQVMDPKYNQWLCAPPLMLNESCVYDQQCQAMDSNSVCGQSDTDIVDYRAGKCQCNDDMVYYKSSCTPAAEVSTRPAIVWWIFTNDYSDNDESSHRFYWLRTASYIMAVLAICLPLLLIVIALIILCYRRILANRMSTSPIIARPKFPAPKIMINEFIKKEKSDDKWDLVNNDHLIKQ